MKRLLILFFCSMVILTAGTSGAQSKAAMVFDFSNAQAMMKVIEALHEKNETTVIEPLLDEALDFEAYKISHERYTDPGRSKDNQVTLSQFRKFLLSFSTDRVDAQNNRRLLLTQPHFEKTIENPDKYKRALQTIQSSASDRFQVSFETAIQWLPEEPKQDLHVWILFDIGGSGAWAYQTSDGRLHIGFNLFHMLDAGGKFDLDLFSGILAHEIHHLGSPLSHYFQSIGYDSLAEGSRLKRYSDYMEPLVTEGMAQKFCNNAPGVLSPKPYPDRTFSATESNLNEWAFFRSQLTDIHRRAVQDLRLLMSKEVWDPEKFEAEYDNYWTWKAGEVEGREIMLGRQYYYGSELMGIINEALGREAVMDGLLDIRKIPALYNEAIRKLHPHKFEEYGFPDDLIQILRKM